MLPKPRQDAAPAPRASHPRLARFVQAEAIDARSVQPWHFAVLGAHTLDTGASAEPEAPGTDSTDTPTATPAYDEAEVERLMAQAWARGAQEGQQQAQEQLQQQWQQRMDAYVSAADQEAAQRLQTAQALLRRVEESMQQLQQDAAREVLHLACDVARQVVRQELRSQPQALLPVVREALDMLAQDQRPARVRLHPDDLAALQAVWPAAQDDAGAAQPQRPIHWQADARLARGDVCVECAGTHIDARVEKRWQRATAALGLVSAWHDGAAADMAR